MWSLVRSKVFVVNVDSWESSLICDWLKLPDIVLVGVDWYRSVVVQYVVIRSRVG